MCDGWEFLWKERPFSGPIEGKVKLWGLIRLIDRVLKSNSGNCSDPPSVMQISIGLQKTRNNNKKSAQIQTKQEKNEVLMESWVGIQSRVLICRKQKMAAAPVWQFWRTAKNVENDKTNVVKKTIYEINLFSADPFRDINFTPALLDLDPVWYSESCVFWIYAFFGFFFITSWKPPITTFLWFTASVFNCDSFPPMVTYKTNLPTALHLTKPPSIINSQTPVANTHR